MPIKMTREQYEKTYGTAPDFSTAKSAPSGGGFIQDAWSDIKQTATNLKNTAVNTFGKQKEALSASIEGKQSLPKGLGQAFGYGAGGLSSAVGDVVTGGVKTLLPQSTEDTLKEGVTSVAKPVMESEFVKRIMEGYEAMDDEQKRDIDAKLGVASLASDFLGFGAAKKPLLSASKNAVRTGEKVISSVKNVSNAVSKVVPPIKNLATGIKDVAVMTGEGLSRLPSRIATNVADNKATREIVESLPSKVAQNAARDGIDINDIKYLYQIPKEQKNPLRQLLKVAKDFESGVSKTNPIEVVGKPIVNRMNQLKTASENIGKKLGSVADQLGSVTTKEVYPAVLNKLKSVNGLSGLKVSKKGILDFTDTVLSTVETAADREAIQNIFMSAIKSGTGKQKHLLRQELFEILGGKKKALTSLTATQERAYEAIRQALSDVLDTKNQTYKTLNSQYAKVARPIQEMSKLMKKVSGADEDILNMSAGLLARRLTSMSRSNPEIRSILRMMDEATKVKGKTTLNIENLQDFYNILDKYFDVSGKTGFQGQVKTGVEKASGFKDAAMQAVGQVVGKTDAVKRKAIEMALEEALR